MAQPLKAVSSEQFFGQDLPGLEAGQTYEFRAVASSTFPGTPVVEAEPQTMTVPAAVAASAPGACPNSALRTGPSANLPDCRAYEQVTPVDKEGAQESFNYGPKVVSGAIVGGDGEHVALEDPSVSWGSGPDGGQSPYFFTRDSSRQEWTMTAGSPEPETGVQRVVPELYSENGSEVASEVDVHTSLGSGESKEILFKAGPGGGPYATVAAVPRDQVEGIAEGNVARNAGWVGASADFSKLILQVEDPELGEARTQTKSGKLDVYEYDEGKLRQVNVGAGTCGAHLVTGLGEANGFRSSAHAVSADGSRVFFEAVPGSTCSAAPHLYMRENGSKTVDIGAFRFGAANAGGTELLLEAPGSGEIKYFLYDTGSASLKQIFSSPSLEPTAHAAADLGAVYFRQANGDLYRYDTAAESLTYLLRIHISASGSAGAGEVTPDGQFYYFQGSVPGVAGVEQAFLYDNRERVVECLSCASPTDSEPALGSYFPDHPSDLGQAFASNGVPSRTFVSDDGDYAFFDTPAALIPADGDGEVTPDPVAGAELQADEISPSSDVYEWRGAGVQECEAPQGCLSLITNGRGGFLNLLLGATPDGQNVYIYTRSELTGLDNDNSGDIYDARVDGGFPPAPARPVECDGAECSTPQANPPESTPSSATYQGLQTPPTPKVSVPPKPLTRAQRLALALKSCYRDRAKKRRLGCERSVRGRFHVGAGKSSSKRAGKSSSKRIGRKR